MFQSISFQRMDTSMFWSISFTGMHKILQVAVIILMQYRAGGEEIILKSHIPFHQENGLHSATNNF